MTTNLDLYIAGCSKDLGYDIRPDGTKYSPLLKSRHLPTDRLFVRVEDLYVSWTSDRDKMVLSNVSFEIQKTRGNKVCQQIAYFVHDSMTEVVKLIAVYRYFLR